LKRFGVTKLEKLSLGCRFGDNTPALRGGFLLWETTAARQAARA
jgi:hypothetical protein